MHKTANCWSTLEADAPAALETMGNNFAWLLCQKSFGFVVAQVPEALRRVPV